jgi:FdhD protein
MSFTGQPVQTYKYTPSGWEIGETGVIGEVPVSLTVNGQVWLTFMCTPTDLEAMAVGFLYTEDLIQSRAEVADVRVCENGTNVDIWLTRSLEKPQHWRRTSGCTGGVTSTEACAPTLDLRRAQTITPEMIMGSMEQLLQAQELYRVMRGVHCSGLSDGYRMYLHAEDIGRHNTLDKLAGMYLMQQPEMERKMIVTTGRISSEMLQKSARLGVTAVVSRTSPTMLSVELANEAGIVLIGYARRNQFNVYAHSELVVEQPATLTLNRQLQAAD